MTSRESYVMGWVCGIIQKKCGDEAIGEFAGDHPYAGLSKALSLAAASGAKDEELRQKIGEALLEIRSIEPELDGDCEKTPSPELQDSWKIGYMIGLGGISLPRDSFDIGTARKQKKMTQVQLASLMGVEQAVISRWESGRVRPNDDNFKKLKEILS